MASAQKPQIFFVGGTGYIGGSILDRMLAGGYLDRFTITVLTRRPEVASSLRALGVEPVLGSIDDLALLRQQSAKSSVVFNLASCDDAPSARAIARGLADRSASSGERPIFIHTSGAGVLSCNSSGLGVSLQDDAGAFLWDDADVEAHAAIPADSPHRHVDLEVFGAARSGLIKTYLVVPPTVFGRGLGPFAQDRMSIQLPRLAYQALRTGRAMFVGTGEAQWTNVHVADLADLYLLLLEAALKDQAPEGLAGLYYPATEFFTWADASDRVGQVLHQQGHIASPTPTTGLPGGWFWGSNVRMTSTNARNLGWTPTKGGTREMLAAIDWDVELILKMARS